MDAALSELLNFQSVNKINHSRYSIQKPKPMNLRIILLIFASMVIQVTKAQLTPTHLSCEYLESSPLVDVMHPRLAWINLAKEGERGQVQTAWQIRVATSIKALDKPDLWDSGKIKSDQSTRVEYNGKALISRQECWWQVRVWDRDGKVSDWSQPDMWRMGLLQPNDWKAQWIGAPWQGEEALPKGPYPDAPLAQLPPPAPMFRKEFKITPGKWPKQLLM